MGDRQLTRRQFLAGAGATAVSMSCINLESAFGAEQRPNFVFILTDDQRFDAMTLAFAPAEKRIWIHEGAGGIVRPIPITNYYNELMICRGIRDPRIALAPSLLWKDLASFPDEDLIRAFVAYNALRRHVPLQGDLPPVRRTGIPLFIRQLFKRRG